MTSGLRPRHLISALDRFATAWAIYQGLLLEAIPFLLVGVLISGLARWLVPQSTWIRRLPRQALLAPITGALMGFALPACECGNVPVARRMLVSGAPLGTAFGFLFAAPVLNPIVMASTWAAFPDQPWLLIARPLGAFLIAIMLSLTLTLLPEGQLLEEALLSERRMNQPLSQYSLLERSIGVVGGGTDQNALSKSDQVATERPMSHLVVEQSSREFLQLMALLLLGCLLSAVVQTWLPRSWLLAVGSAPTASILALMLLAVVVSVCSSVDAFLALGFAALVTPGALLAFLLLGPVVDLKLVGLFSVLLRPRAIAITTATASLGVLLIGQWINLWRL